MRKGKLIRALKRDYEVNVKYYSHYDFEIKVDSKTYYVKVLNVSLTHQVTINSKYVWNLKKGKLSGIKFVTLDSELLNLKEFNKLDNKIIIFTNKPYKILKVLNESDLKDISNEKIVNNIFITHDLDDLIEYIK